MLARQTKVDIGADAAKPLVTLGDRLNLLDHRQEELIIDSSNQPCSRQDTEHCQCQPENKWRQPTLFQKLELRIMQLERKPQTLQASAIASHKTARGQVLQKQKHSNRPGTRVEEANATTVETIFPTPNMQYTMKTVLQHP